MDIRELDRRALAYAGEIVAGVGADRLTAPTPCPDWTLYGLLRHMVGLNEGFAAAARGGGADLTVWRNGRLGADPRGALPPAPAPRPPAVGGGGGGGPGGGRAGGAGG